MGSNIAGATPLIGSEGPGHQAIAIGGVPLITPSAMLATLSWARGRSAMSTTIRVYVFHCLAIPLIAAYLMALHFWRIRKDGFSGPL